MEIDLRGANHLQFIGTATSHFQAEPLPVDLATVPVLDWESEVLKSVRGKSAHIHYRQYLQDLPHLLEKPEQYTKRSNELGMNMFRFSLEAGRLSPKIGEFNEKLMARYVGFMALLKSQGQEPMITLQHYTMPLSYCRIVSGDMETGAWEDPDIVSYFQYVTKKIVGFLCDQDKVRAAIRDAGIPEGYAEAMLVKGLVSWFITLNEPIMTPLQGYLSGLYPPYKKSKLGLAKKVLGKMVEVHDVMYSLLKDTRSSSCAIHDQKVGIAYNWSYLDGALGFISHKLMNEWLYADRFERDGSHSDFLGVQYYFRETPPFFGKKWRGRVYSEHPGFGDICPAGILEVLKRMHRAYPKKDVFITEFGFPDTSDQRRPYWIMQTFLRVLEAIRIGIPVRGILHWSLVDNFEWDWGTDQRFGLLTEAQTERPLARDEDDSQRIHSWEAWKACATRARMPSKRSELMFDRAYELAKVQYDGFRYCEHCAK